MRYINVSCVLLASLGIIVSMGCQTVEFTSTPSGALIEGPSAFGQISERTPFTGDVPVANEDVEYTATLTCYDSKTLDNPNSGVGYHFELERNYSSEEVVRSDEYVNLDLDFPPGSSQYEVAKSKDALECRSNAYVGADRAAEKNSGNANFMSYDKVLYRDCMRSRGWLPATFFCDGSVRPWNPSSE